MEDNKRFSSFFIPEIIPVLILADNLADTKLVEAALKSVSEKDYFELTIKKVEQVSGTQLDNYQVIILISSNFVNAKDKLSQFLSTGKSLIIFPSSDLNSENFISSLNSINVSASGGFVKINSRAANSF